MRVCIYVCMYVYTVHLCVCRRRDLRLVNNTASQYSRIKTPSAAEGLTAHRFVLIFYNAVPATPYRKQLQTSERIFAHEHTNIQQ